MQRRWLFISDMNLFMASTKNDPTETWQYSFLYSFKLKTCVRETGKNFNLEFEKGMLKDWKYNCGFRNFKFQMVIFFLQMWSTRFYWFASSGSQIVFYVTYYSWEVTDRGIPATETPLSRANLVNGKENWKIKKCFIFCCYAYCPSYIWLSDWF